MAASVSNITFISASTGNVSGKNEDNYDSVMKAIFCIISIASIVPNMLFLIAMLLNYSRMRGGYHNILLYNMMISDTLAGNAYFMIFIKYMIYSIVYIMPKWKNLGKTKLFLYAVTGRCRYRSIYRRPLLTFCCHVYTNRCQIRLWGSAEQAKSPGSK
jgi:hypothetical protein